MRTLSQRKRKQRAPTRKQRAGGSIEATILNDLIACYHNINSNDITLPVLLDSCQNVSVLKLIKLHTFIKNHEKEFIDSPIYNDIKLIQNEIDNYINKVSRVKSGGGIAHRIVGVLAFLAAYANALGPDPEVAAQPPAIFNPYNASLAFYQGNQRAAPALRGSRKYNVPSAPGLRGSIAPEKVITFGQQADIVLYKTTAAKIFKGDQAGDNYADELSAMQKIEKIPALRSIPIVKMVAHDNDALSITYTRFEKDATSLTSDTVNGDLHADGELNVMAGFSPKAVSAAQAQEFVKSVSVLHNNGVAHGDIHAGNIFLMNGQLGLADMALAKFDPRMHGNGINQIDQHDMHGAIAKVTNIHEWEALLANRKFGAPYRKLLARKPQLKSFFSDLEDFLKAKDFDNVKLGHMVQFFPEI